MSNKQTPPGCPAGSFYRGEMIWFTIKTPSGTWVNKSTKFRRGQEAQAARVIAQARRSMAERTKRGEKGPLTLRIYVKRWCDERETRGIDSATTERARLDKYVLPAKVDGDHVLGDLPLEEIRPYHARDLVRGLKARTGDDKLAPRTIIHIYRLLHNVFTSALVEERVMSNPIKIEKAELPKKVDKDREWRINATYTVKEVERLISDPLIPPERRVLYALKAIAGMRHGEAAALCWRHIDHSVEPLAKINIVQAYNSIKRVLKGTKSEETREVPLHPTLAKILEAWKLKHWPRIYGRAPTDDDFVAPTRTMQPVNVADLGHAMHDDLDALGLRKEAGSKKRGGHDLRGWYKTRTVEDGADSLIIRRTTHAPPKDVEGGYQRFSWSTICREVGKLKVELVGDALPLLTPVLQREKRAGARWPYVVTPLGLELYVKRKSSDVLSPVSVGKAKNERRLDMTREETGERTRLTAIHHTAAAMLERALLLGDVPRALRITREIAGRPEAGSRAKENDDAED